MKRHFKSFIIVFLLILTRYSTAQSVKDSAFRIVLTGVHFSGQLPRADLAERFGANLSAGADLILKTKKNFIFGIEGSYFFGKNVKEDVISSLRNTEGFVTDNEGYPADLRLTQRGWNFYANVGRVFSKLGHNPNSGLVITVGAGYMQHKVNLYDASKKVAAVKGNLAKGYDHLSGGFGLTQFIGYQYLSNNRLANFNIGIEFYEGFTQSFRGFNYNTGLKDDIKRRDILTGLRFTWILPLYKRGKDFYYY